MNAWVDPQYGSDPSYSTPIDPLNPSLALVGQINDPNSPYKTLQAAIDAVHAHLGWQYTAGATTQGIVHALPGLYGNHGAGSSGDVFPIKMRDRVNVRGLGARRCVIRGTGTRSGTTSNPPASTINVFWPLGNGQPSGGGANFKQAEVLVDYGFSAQQFGGFWSGAQGVPWASMPDTAESLDDFTFEGGDVQVLVTSHPGVFDPEALSGKITNCVFDMRDYWSITPGASTTVSGPWFGVMLTKNLFINYPPSLAYPEQKFLVANNTFVLAHYTGDGLFESLSRDVAVGLIDVTNPCSNGTCESTPTQRGMGNPIIANNLFRLPPDPSDRRRAMLGIDDTDVRIDDGTGAFLPSNAHRVANLTKCTTNYTTPGGGTGFYSAPVRSSTVLFGTLPLLKPCTTGCSTVVAPTPRVVLWDGTTSTSPQQYDPGFVGEYLESFISPPVPTLPRILDWRLLPDSALKNKGIISNAPGLVAPVPFFVAANGTFMNDSDCPELASYRWDGEGYGNPRIVDGAVDIGFDEIDSLIACGTWGNHSSSHNAPPPLLQPTALQGRSTRYYIFDKDFAGRACTIHGAGAIPVSPPVAWSKPPETLVTPVTNPAYPGLAAERKTRYIAFTDAGPTPTGPTGAGWVIQAGSMNATSWLPPPTLRPTGTSNRTFILATTGVDDDANGSIPPGSSPPTPQPNLYFSCEARLLWVSGATNAIWWSNLQSEYR